MAWADSPGHGSDDPDDLLERRGGLERPKELDGLARREELYGNDAFHVVHHLRGKSITLSLCQGFCVTLIWWVMET